MLKNLKLVEKSVNESIDDISKIYYKKDKKGIANANYQDLTNLINRLHGRLVTISKNIEGWWLHT